MRKFKAIQKKVLISMLILFSMVGTLFAASLGDVNNDGSVTIIDALQIAQYSVGLSVPGFDSSVADANIDGNINIVDALAVARYYVQLDTLPPGGVTPTPVSITPTPPPFEGHVENPFAGAKWYVNKDWTAKAIADGGSALANISTAVWMDRIAAIDPEEGTSLEEHLNNTLAQGANLFMVVIYDLPGRDCRASASNGELPNTSEGLDRYKHEYIDPIVSIFSRTEYQGIRIVCIIEPDSLPNLVTNENIAACAAVKSSGVYIDGIQYALNQLSAIPNVYNYVDIAHSGWLGWDSNLDPGATLITNAIKGTAKSFESVDGFVSNTANYTPTKEEFLPDPTYSLNGTPIRSANFYEWNFHFEEVSYVNAMRTAFISKGFPSSIGMLIDTSRNGWGGAARPTSASTSSDVNTYVNESRIDQRVHRGNWCNQIGAGIGFRPEASPSANIDAYVWVKPPGESDGVSESGIVDPDDPAKQYDTMCGPNEQSSYNSSFGTGAMPNCPHAGRWNSTHFKELLANAYPSF